MDFNMFKCHVSLTTLFKAASASQHSRSTVQCPSILPPISLFERHFLPPPTLPAPPPPHPHYFPLPTEAQSKPYYSDYSRTRLLIHKMCTSHYLDLFITIVIGLNVIAMSMEHYQQPEVRCGGLFAYWVGPTSTKKDITDSILCYSAV